MIKLKLKLKGDAEKGFQEMIDWSGADKEKIAMDAFDLLHHIMQEAHLGKLGGVLPRVSRINTTIIQPHPDALWRIEYPPQCKCQKKKK